MPHAADAVLQSKTRERAVYRCLSRTPIHLGFERRCNRLGTKFTQHALTQLEAKFSDALFNLKRRTVPGPTWLPISKIGTIEPFATRTPYPESDYALAKTELIGGLAHVHARSNRFQHRPTA